MACAACRYTGPPEPRVRQELHAARSALWAADARRRQLGWTQQRLGVGARSGGGLGCLLALVLVPFASCGGLVFGVNAGSGLADVGTAILFLGPTVFTLAAGAIILRAVKKAQLEVESACAAVPPSIPGAPLGCHVCGADLPAADLSRVAVLRCRYCSADNIVRNDVLQAAVARGIRTTEALIHQVGRHAVALYHHKRRSTALVIALLLIAPFASLLAGISAFVFSPTVEPTERYVLIRTSVGFCVSKQLYKNAEGRITLVFGARSPHADRTKDVHFDRKVPSFRASDLVGAKGKTLDREGTVARADRNAFLGVESVYFDEPTSVPASPEDLCFAELPEGLTAVDPP